VSFCKNNKKYSLDFAQNTLYNIIIVNRITWKNKFTMTTDAVWWLFPAYGREYHSPAQALEAWQAGQDFQMGDKFGPYCSIRDLPELKLWGQSIRLCFSRSPNVFIEL
jgi:hypothetical protein